MLSQELANEGADPNIRTAAGLAVKNSLTAKVSDMFWLANRASLIIDYIIVSCDTSIGSQP